MSRRLGRILFVPYCSSFISDMTTSVLGLAIPIRAYLLGASTFDIGIIGAVGSIVYVLATMISSRISGRVGTKSTLVLSSTLMAMASVGFSLTDEHTLFVPLSALHNLSLGLFWPNIEGVVARGVDQSETKKALQGFNISWSIGWIAGPPIGGFLLSSFPSSVVFYTTSALYIVGSLVLSFVGRIQVVSGYTEQRKKGDRGVLTYLRSYPIAYAAAFVFAFINRTQGSLFPAYGISLGLSPITTGSIMLFPGLLRTAVFTISDKLDKRLRSSALYFGLALLTLATTGIFFGAEPWQFALALSLLGLGSGLSYYSSITTVLEVPDEAVGLRASLFESMIGVGGTLGPFLGGLVSTIDQRYPYALGVALCLPFFVKPIQIASRNSEKRRKQKTT